MQIVNSEVALNVCGSSLVLTRLRPSRQAANLNYGTFTRKQLIPTPDGGRRGAS